MLEYKGLLKVSPCLLVREEHALLGHDAMGPVGLIGMSFTWAQAQDKALSTAAGAAGLCAVAM